MARLDLAKEMEQDILAQAREYRVTMKRGEDPAGLGSVSQFRWWEVQCAEPSCNPSWVAEMGITANCDHIRLIRNLGLDAEHMMDSAKGNKVPYNAVLASLRLRDASTKPHQRKRGYVNFAVAFGDLKTIWIDRKPLWGTLWMVHPIGGSKGYKFDQVLESEIVFSRPEKMTTNRVRTLGLQYLVEQYFGGIKCDDPSHGLRGKTLLDQPRKVSLEHWRKIHVLDDVARIISDGVCLTCQNSAGSFGLADL